MKYFGFVWQVDRPQEHHMASYRCRLQHTCAAVPSRRPVSVCSMLPEPIIWNQLQFVNRD